MIGIILTIVVLIIIVACAITVTKLAGFTKRTTVSIEYCGRVQHSFNEKLEAFKNSVNKRFDKTDKILEKICKKL